MNLTEHGCTVVWVRGEHDISTATELGDELLTATMGDKSDLVLDLSSLSFMDASTVGVIVHVRQVLRGQSRKLALRSPSAFIRQVLDLCGVADLLEDEAAGPPQMVGAVGLSSWVEVPRASADATHSSGAFPIETVPDQASIGSR